MSWDKNTINYSTIDAIVGVLKDIGVDYKLSVIAKVRGRGLNDYEGKVYELRRLEYKNIVYLEKIEQEADCDFDDIIRSQKFKLSKEPKGWQAIVKTDILNS